MYNETDAIKHINNTLKQKFGVTYNDDDILNVIDIIWDYYEDNGLLDLDSDNDIDIEDLLDTVNRLLKKDKENQIKAEHIEAIVRSEMDYEDTIILEE